jgi:hypothetical protein
LQYVVFKLLILNMICECSASRVFSQFFSTCISSFSTSFYRPCKE